MSIGVRTIAKTVRILERNQTSAKVLDLSRVILRKKEKKMIVGFVLFIGLMATMFIIYFPPSDKEIALYQARLKKELEEKEHGILKD